MWGRMSPLVISDHIHASVAVSGAAGDGLPGSPAEWKAPLAEMLTDPTQLAGSETLKYSKSTRVYRVPINVAGHSRETIAKQWIARGVRGRAAELLGKSRARRSLLRAQWLHMAGVGTARPLALVEDKREHASWLITESIEDPLDLDRVALVHLPALNRCAAYACKRAIVQHVVDVFVRLRRAGLHHRDLKASNLLLTNIENLDDLQVWIVDLDGLSRVRLPRGIRMRRPLIRLAASLLSYAAITRSDYARFLQMYLKAIPESARFNEVFRQLADAARRYVTESRRRKVGKLDGYNGS